MASIPSSHQLVQPQVPRHFGNVEIAQETSNLEEAAVTLLIRHLPEAIPHDMISRLVSYYGASSIRPCAGGRVKNCAFADFKNEALASQAQHQLNGLRFLGKVLSVERASKEKDNKYQLNEPQSGKDSTPQRKDVIGVKDLVGGVKSASFPAKEPIAEKLGVDYPFPPDLEYLYPPPDGNILTNIVNALIAVPRFYTQVLHLMNKMNIPAPFRMALPTPPLPPPVSPPPPPLLPEPSKSSVADFYGDESEMESSDEEIDDNVHPIGASSATKKRKRIKREAIVGPAINKDVAHETVGLKPSSLVPKEIPVIRKKNPVLQIKIVPKKLPLEQKNDSAIEQVDQNKEPKPYLTPEELESGKLPPEEILSLPKFKSYTAGNPVPVLYIKNLAKDVAVDDFYFIFGSIFGSIDTAKAGLGVKLLKEGRMRGQAFVTFPSVELAHSALNLVNGYVLKGKPMIIQFSQKQEANKAN